MAAVVDKSPPAARLSAVAAAGDLPTTNYGTRTATPRPGTRPYSVQLLSMPTENCSLLPTENCSLWFGAAVGKSPAAATLQSLAAVSQLSPAGGQRRSCIRFARRSCHGPIATTLLAGLLQVPMITHAVAVPPDVDDVTLADQPVDDHRRKAHHDPQGERQLGGNWQKGPGFDAVTHEAFTGGRLHDSNLHPRLDEPNVPRASYPGVPPPRR